MEKKEYRFDNFGVADALGKKTKRFVACVDGVVARGEKPEAVAGLMAWKARQMKTSNSPANSCASITTPTEEQGAGVVA